MNQRSVQWISLSILILLILFVGTLVVVIPHQILHGWELWRAALYLIMGSLLWYGQVVDKEKLVDLFSWVALALVLLGSVTLLFNSPAAPMFGGERGYDLDFHTNYVSAQELYVRSGEVYGIESKLDLQNPSVSFPFPTYYYYHVASLDGRLSETATAGVFTLAQLFLYLLGLWASIGLAGGKQVLGSGAERRIRLFLILSVPALVSVNLGQTSLIASTSILAGFYLVYHRKGWGWFLLGMIVWSVGVLTKPNFVLTWAIFFGVAWKQFAEGGWDVRQLISSRSFLAALAAPIMLLALITLTLVTPAGVTLETYRQFLFDIYPTLGQRLFWYWNVSPMQGLARLTGGLLSSSLLAVLIILLYFGYGIWKRSGAAYWFMLALVASPIVWNHYLGIVTPVLLALYVGFRGRKDVLATGVLLMMPGMLNMVYFPLPATGILLLAMLSMKNGRLDGLTPDN